MARTACSSAASKPCAAQRETLWSIAAAAIPPLNPLIAVSVRLSIRLHTFAWLLNPNSRPALQQPAGADARLLTEYNRIERHEGEQLEKMDLGGGGDPRLELPVGMGCGGRSRARAALDGDLGEFA